MLEREPEAQKTSPSQPFGIPERKYQSNTAKPKVLILDDDELVRDSLRILIKNYGYDIRAAANGFEALELLDEEPFALLICDIRMPGINGIETVKAMRETSRLDVNRTLPVIFITGYCDDRLEREARSLGHLAYLTKPFDDTQIWHLLKVHLG